VLCCNGVSDNLDAVSIKMAKTQNLSLNSMKISGPCGRLLCCLAYEYDFYRDSTKGLPNVGTRAAWGDATMRVTDVNVLTGTIRLEGEERSIEVRADEVQPSRGRHRWQVVRDTPAPESRADEENLPTD
jgi:cell fate regulator YaaT (PSP1 superfamily)